MPMNNTHSNEGQQADRSQLAGHFPGSAPAVLAYRRRLVMRYQELCQLEEEANAKKQEGQSQGQL